MAENFDVVIIGAGPGGYNCAIRCGQLGLTTAIIEKNPTLGGTCLNVGCIPSKALLHASELYHAAQHDFAELGIETGGVSLNLDKMMAQKNTAVKGLTDGVAYLMKKNKVKVITGTGSIVAAGKVTVKNGENTTELLAKNIVIATGSEPTSLPNIEIDETRVVTNTGALKFQTVPKRLTIIGGGIIGLELGSVWSRLGADVTVIEYMDHILPGTDQEIAKEALKIFKAQGLAFELGQKVLGVEKLKSKLKVTIEPAKGGDKTTHDTDAVIVAVGRRPYTQGLGLENVGATTDKRGIIETPLGHFKIAEGVWAIGDCIAGPMLAHKAEDDGTAVAELIAGKAGHVNYDLVPGVVYTSPEIAWVGKNEAELKAAGIAYNKGKFPFQANSRARANNVTTGFVKILADKTTDEVLGVHMIGTGVGEMIGEACVAMEFRASSEDIARTCHAHPTHSEAVRQAAMGVEGWAMQM